jgi:hypothetical protein
MGGLANIIADSSYAGPNVGYSLPVSRGARSLFFPRVDGATSVANKVDALAGGVGNGAIVGSPSYQPGYATLKGLTNYIATQSTDSASSTLIAVIRDIDTEASNATTPVVAGNMTWNTSGYLGRLTLSGGVLKYESRYVSNNGSVVNNGGTSTQVTLTDNTWCMVASVFDDVAKTITTYNLSTGETKTISYTGSHVPGVTNVRFGSSVDFYSGNIDMAFCDEQNVALTFSELTTIKLEIQAKLAAYASPIIF